mmetsp:Transcript_64554/g.145662  ORF Transcript_64554/g.145662 Transcript_64554/m.145662 type:complete len:207 (-) Transcript_64554:86-706(-)
MLLELLQAESTAGIRVHLLENLLHEGHELALLLHLLLHDKLSVSLRLLHGCADKHGGDHVQQRKNGKGDEEDEEQGVLPGQWLEGIHNVGPILAARHRHVEGQRRSGERAEVPPQVLRVRSLHGAVLHAVCDGPICEEDAKDEENDEHEDYRPCQRLDGPREGEDHETQLTDESEHLDVARLADHAKQPQDAEHGELPQEDPQARD